MTLNIKNPEAFTAPTVAARHALAELDALQSEVRTSARKSLYLHSDHTREITRHAVLESLHGFGVGESITTFDTLAAGRPMTFDAMREVLVRWGIVHESAGIVSADVSADGTVTAVYMHADRPDAITAAALRAAASTVASGKRFCMAVNGVVAMTFSVIEDAEGNGDARIASDPEPPAAAMNPNDAAVFARLRDAYLSSLSKLTDTVSKVNAMIAEQGEDGEGEQGDNKELDALGDKLPDMVEEVNKIAAEVLEFAGQIAESYAGELNRWEALVGAPPPKSARDWRDKLAALAGDLVDVTLEADDGMAFEYFVSGKTVEENKALLAALG